MKDIGEGTIRRIDWTELTPVVLLLRVFNVALGVRVLAFGLLGSFLTTLFYLLLTSTVPLYLLLQPVPVHTTPILDFWRDIFMFPKMTIVEAGEMCYGVLEPYLMFSVWEHPKWFLWLPGVVLIWAFCGGAICRIVALRLTVDESESTKNLFLFFRKRGIGFISSLIILSLGILCCYLPVQIAYWLAAIPGLDLVVAILFPIPLLFAFFTVILTLGLAVGWMLLFAAVSTDGSDGFDAISRMFSYIFQRPLHYIFYWFCSGILGCLGLLLVLFVSTFVVDMFRDFVFTPNFSDFFTHEIASFWISLVQSLPLAYAFAWFWTSSVAIYLLLRRSVDATPFTEVYRVAPPKVRMLPTIKQDERGAPEMKQAKPEAEV